MKKYFIFLAILIGSSDVIAQQDAMYSQYMFNPFVINPGYAGSRESISAVLLYRDQWLGLNGAPTTQTFSIHAPFSAKKMAVGLSVINDKIGPTNSTAAFGTYAYHLRLGPGKLAFGLRGGLYSTRLDRDQLEYKDPTDKFNAMGTVTSSVPSFDFGMYYYTKKFYTGLSATHLSQEKIGFNDYPEEAELFLRRHYMLAVGGAIELSENVVFKPSMLLRSVEAAPASVDINASFLFRKVFWLGVSARSSNGMVLMTEYNITDYLRVGYAYDMVFSPLRRFNSGSHELFVGFDFNISKTQIISPRYL